jgi:SNF2 family DNA or RNA helicase
VFVHKLVSAGTVEERIDELIASKRDLAERVLGSDEEWMTELSTDDLRDLVDLRSTDLDTDGAVETIARTAVG